MIGARWHLAVDGQQFGPYDDAALAAMLRSGQVNADSAYAWTEGMEGWALIRDVPQLASLPSPVPAPRPTRGSASASTEGAGFSDADEDQAIDLNQASAEELLALPAMTRDGAALLVREREARGGLRDVEQVGELLRLQPHEVERMRGQAVFGRLAAAAPRVVDF